MTLWRCPLRILTLYWCGGSLTMARAAVYICPKRFVHVHSALHARARKRHVAYRFHLFHLACTKTTYYNDATNTKGSPKKHNCTSTNGTRIKNKTTHLTQKIQHLTKKTQHVSKKNNIVKKTQRMSNKNNETRVQQLHTCPPPKKKTKRVSKN